MTMKAPLACPAILQGTPDGSFAKPPAVYKRSGQSPLKHPLKRQYVLEIDAPRRARREGLAPKVPAEFPQHSLPAARTFHWIGARPEKASDLVRAAYAKYWIDADRLDEVAERLAA